MDDSNDASGTDEVDMGLVGSLDPTFDDEIAAMMLNLLGATSMNVNQRYRREKSPAMKRLVSETYSPPRITEELRQNPRRHIPPGFVLDLTANDPDDGTPWDSNVAYKRGKAK